MSELWFSVAAVSIRQRLYPESGQVAGLRKHADDARFVFSLGLGQRSLWRREKHNRGTHPEYGALDAARVTTTTQMRDSLNSALRWTGCARAHRPCSRPHSATSTGGLRTRWPPTRAR